MSTRIWTVRYGSIDSVSVVAPNVKEAIVKARAERKGEWGNRLHDITEITLEAEA